jgi:hypothetical protein
MRLRSMGETLSRRTENSTEKIAFEKIIFDAMGR